MILLDSDHVSVLRYPESKGHNALRARMIASEDQDFGVPVVSVEEQMRGWLALINRLRDIHQQIPAYERLASLFTFFSDWQIIPLDQSAADTFNRLRRERIRIGTQDLKIASIALAQDGLLLSANLRDFQRVPDLRVENWLE
jgi:tRNA(fMet)-specific endonuclease VapC